MNRTERIPSNEADATYSLSKKAAQPNDSQGRQLTDEQAEYFKNSKVVDDNSGRDRKRRKDDLMADLTERVGELETTVTALTERLMAAEEALAALEERAAALEEGEEVT